jgi:hypothetical protein
VQPIEQRQRGKEKAKTKHRNLGEVVKSLARLVPKPPLPSVSAKIPPGLAAAAPPLSLLSLLEFAFPVRLFSAATDVRSAASPWYGSASFPFRLPPRFREFRGAREWGISRELILFRANLSP